MEQLFASSLIFAVLGAVLGLVTLILWIFLPFALIGTKPLLRQLIREVQRTNALLERGMEASEAGTVAATAPEPAVWRSGRDAGQAHGPSASS